MDIVLRAGVTGLLVAQSLKMKGKDFIILEKGSKENFSNAGGFFYNPRPNPFTYPDPFPITITACPGSTLESYKQKIYGDAHLHGKKPSIDKFRDKTVQGWAFDWDKLRNGVSEHIHFFQEVYSIDAEWGRKVVYTKTGNAFRYKILHNTMSFPIFHKMVEYSKLIDLHTKAITLELEKYGPAVPHNIQEMVIKYCGAECHKWYRRTKRIYSSGPGMESSDITTEYIDPPVNSPYKTVNLKPGKIWFETIYEEDTIRKIKANWKTMLDIRTYGRFGSWSPGMLSADVWDEVKPA